MKSEPYYQDYYWLEHLERELSPNLRKDLQILLRNSYADREIYQSLEAVRLIVKASDELPMPEDGTYYERLHDRIMASLEAKTQLEIVVKELSRKFSTNLRALQETEAR